MNSIQSTQLFCSYLIMKSFDHQIMPNCIHFNLVSSDCVHVIFLDIFPRYVPLFPICCVLIVARLCTMLVTVSTRKRHTLYHFSINRVGRRYLSVGIKSLPLLSYSCFRSSLNVFTLIGYITTRGPRTNSLYGANANELSQNVRMHL